MPLTDTQCRNLKAIEKPRKVSDGGGLFLQIEPTGSKLWRLAYRFEGKQKLLSLGRYPAVSLKDARGKRDAARELLAKEVDPSIARKAEKAKGKLEAGNTFEAVAREWFDHRKAGWVPTYAGRLLSRLEADIFPVLGHRPINEIEPPELLEAIRAIERREAVVLAGRILQVCGRIFRYAVATGRATRDPSQDLRGALKSAGPRKRRAALKAEELPAFLQALETYQGDRSTLLAIKLTLHTMLRTQEVRFGQWAEIEGLDGPSPLWRLAQEVKTKTECSGLLIVVDTLSRAIAGGDENSPVDMTAFIANVDAIRAETGAHVMVIHHSGKDIAKGARGHSSLRAATDTEIELRENGGVRVANVAKQRDLAGGENFTFSLRRVDLGTDQDGDTVTSCVVVFEAAPYSTVNLTKQPLTALNILNDLAASGKPVTKGEWQRACVASGKVSAAKDEESQASSVRRAIKQLLEKNIVELRGDVVRRKEEPDAGFDDDDLEK